MEPGTAGQASSATPALGAVTGPLFAFRRLAPVGGEEAVDDFGDAFAVLTAGDDVGVFAEGGDGVGDRDAEAAVFEKRDIILSVANRHDLPRREMSIFQGGGQAGRLRYPFGDDHELVAIA